MSTARTQLAVTIAIAVSLITSPALAVTGPASAAELAKIQARGDSDITARISALTTLETKVGATTKLSSAQQASLGADLKDQVTSLQELKIQLDADTVLATAKTDFQSIFTKHYIYAFYVPRVERIVAADFELNAAATLTAVATKLQAYLDQANQQGADTTAVTAALDDMTTMLTNAQSKAQAAVTALLPLTASGYPGNKTTIQTAGASVKTARADLTAARTDATTVITGLKQLLPNVQ